MEKRALGTLAVVAVAVATACQASHASAFNPDPAFPIGPISGTTSHQIAKLDHVATVLAGRHTIVNCWSQHDWTRLQSWDSAHREYELVDALGVTNVAKRRVELSPFVCQALSQAIGKSTHQPLFTAEAVNVLAHESAHASGVEAEDRAECRAIETDTRAAKLLGLPRSVATAVPHIYRGTVYPYDEPRYRTPVCPAGLPAKVVPDTLGLQSNLRPLNRVAAAVARSLRGWRNLGGAFDIGPLSPCAPIKSRFNELARFGETLRGPNRLTLAFTAARLFSQRAYDVALPGYARLPQCDLRVLRQLARTAHAPGTYSLGRIPRSITRLSPDVRAHRFVWVNRERKWNQDTIFVFDPSERAVATLYFPAPAGKLPLSVELRATRAALRASGD